MNLSNKQVQALVRELLPVIVAQQKEQLESIKAKVKEQCLKRVMKLKLPFADITWYVVGIEINCRAIAEHLGFDISYDNHKVFRSIEDLTDYVYQRTIAKEFKETFWNEIKANDIEHEVIIWTIWAETVQWLIDTVKAKLLSKGKFNS